MVKPGQKKPIKYDGKMTDIREIFEFLNKYQETFAMENSAADEELAQKKPWLSEALPELTSLSAQDICYGYAQTIDSRLHGRNTIATR